MWNKTITQYKFLISCFHVFKRCVNLQIVMETSSFRRNPWKGFTRSAFVCQPVCADTICQTPAVKVNSSKRIWVNSRNSRLFIYLGPQPVILVLISITLSVRNKLSALTSNINVCVGESSLDITSSQKRRIKCTKSQKWISVLQDKCWLSPKCGNNDSTIKLQQWATQKYVTMQQTIIVFTGNNHRAGRMPHSYKTPK